MVTLIQILKTQLNFPREDQRLFQFFPIFIRLCFKELVFFWQILRNSWILLFRYSLHFDHKFADNFIQQVKSMDRRVIIWSVSHMCLQRF